jgi:hypothetical protein
MASQSSDTCAWRDARFSAHAVFALVFGFTHDFRRPFLLRLTHGRTAALARTGIALLLVWVNVRTTAPLVCQHEASGGVYTIRHILHAAISLDDGQNWLGHREIYRDPLMQAEPPSRGDIGVAYSYGLELASGEVLLRSGQGLGRTQLIRLDPAWLLETTKRADFTTARATTTWNRQQAIGSPDYVSTCMYYRHFGHSTAPEQFKCGLGHDGTALRKLVPETASSSNAPVATQALCMAQPPGVALATALWNFPSQQKGRIVALISTVPPATSVTTRLGGLASLNATFALADAVRDKPAYYLCYTRRWLNILALKVQPTD